MTEEDSEVPSWALNKACDGFDCPMADGEDELCPGCPYIENIVGQYRRRVGPYFYTLTGKRKADVPGWTIYESPKGTLCAMSTEKTAPGNGPGGSALTGTIVLSHPIRWEEGDSFFSSSALEEKIKELMKLREKEEVL